MNGEKNDKEAKIKNTASSNEDTNIAQSSADNGKNDAKKPQKTNSENKNEENETAELKERLLRLAAEFDNYKKRTSNEIMQAKDIGMSEFAKSLLTVIDEFELTLIAAQESSDKNLAKGIELVYTNFIDALKKLGLKEICTDKGFDPYMHEIVMVKEHDSKEGTILEVIKKGYMFKDRILRPSSVIVSKAKSESEQENVGERTE